MREWSPYGEEVGGAQAGLGYTGEWFDTGVELQYLRARWYQPDVGRFTSLDFAIPDYQRPGSLHHYAYVVNNAINLMDPSGLTPNPQYPDNPYDLTSWLYDELATNSNGYYAQRIRVLGRRLHLFPAKAVVDKTRALAAWIFLVKDKAKWDFKHEVRRVLRSDKFALSDGKELHWYEYSVTGNIHYGFVGRAAGFTAWELYAGAGYAEITDPAHVERGEACCLGCWYPPETGPAYEVCINLGCYYINPDWITSFLDDPQDKAGVEFGVQMYDLYGKGLTMAQFKEYLAVYGNTLTPAPPVYGPSMPNAAWPYHVGYFNGPDDEANERLLRMLLAKW